MRKIIFLFIFNTAYGDVFPQGSLPTLPCPLVAVSDWRQRTIFYLPNAFDEAEPEILSHVSKEEFELIKKYGSNQSWPAPMRMIWREYRDPQKRQENREKDSMEKAEQPNKLNRLKMYKIATFTHIYNGKKGGRRVILKVPYRGNESWDSTAKWDVVYFLVKENAVKEL